VSEQREQVADVRVRQARARLSSRLEALERKIGGTVDCTTETVRETAGAVRQTVSRVADDVGQFYQHSVEGVKHMIDIRQHVRDYPCQSVGLAAFAGFLAGSLGHRIPQMKNLVANYGELRASNGFLGQFADMAKAELLKIGETAIRTASAALRDNVQSMADEFRPTGNGVRPHHNGVHADAI
jgi:ElaB/YqjD/DUF883 family membrane-anchored ribosome-binding protein